MTIFCIHLCLTGVALCLGQVPHKGEQLGRVFEGKSKGKPLNLGHPD